MRLYVTAPYKLISTCTHSGGSLHYGHQSEMEPKQHTKSTGSCMRLCLKRSNASSARMRTSQGKVYIVTGANSGVGYAAAKALAAKNARVYMASRNRDKQQRSADQSSSQTQLACSLLCLYNALSSSTYCSNKQISHSFSSYCPHKILPARACEDIKREFPYAQVDWLECDLGNLRYLTCCYC